MISQSLETATPLSDLGSDEDEESSADVVLTVYDYTDDSDQGVDYPECEMQRKSKRSDLDRRSAESFNRILEESKIRRSEAERSDLERGGAEGPADRAEAMMTLAVKRPLTPYHTALELPQVHATVKDYLDILQ